MVSARIVNDNYLVPVVIKALKAVEAACQGPNSMTGADNDRAKRILRRVSSQVPLRTRTAVRRRLARLNYPRWGNLRRREPFSSYYGFDRGTPVDRFYIERFLSDRAQDIRSPRTILALRS